MQLAQRLRIFVDAGLIPQLPNAWQVAQGEAAMAPWVLSADATFEPRYAGALLGHSWLRQPLIFSQIGLDHLRIGIGLGCQLDSLCKHLHFTFHQGMPLWDLQVVQTYPGGLDTLRMRTEELLADRSPRARRHNRLLRLILPRAADYHDRFLGEDGWIARAARLDYPSPEEAGASMPREFFSLVEFMNHASRFPAAHPWYARPGVLLHQFGRRFREGRPMGWFARPVRDTAGAAA